MCPYGCNTLLCILRLPHDVHGQHIALGSTTLLTANRKKDSTPASYSCDSRSFDIHSLSIPKAKVMN